MKYLGSTILLLVLGAGSSLTATVVGWNTNFNSALDEAKRTQQPVLLYFTASWCEPCKLMARTTLTNEAVMQTLSSLVHVALDVDEHPKLSEQQGVRAVPTFQMLSPDGNAVATTTGYQEAKRFLSWLTNSIIEAKEVVARQKQFAGKLAAADQSLRDASPESLRKAASELIDLCATGNGESQKAVLERLASLVALDPPLVLDGLNHPRLAVRIHVANLMRERLGDAFDVDPWSDASARKKAVAQWRAKLADKKPTGGKSP